MKGKIVASECKRTFKETGYSVLITVGNLFIVHPLNTHSSPAPLSTPEFQSKGRMISL